MHAVESGMRAVESGMHAVESGMHAVESGMHAVESVKVQCVRDSAKVNKTLLKSV